VNECSNESFSLIFGDQRGVLVHEDIRPRRIALPRPKSLANPLTIERENHGLDYT
jgi:hypothetical protein